jgi:hypothetical protein
LLWVQILGSKTQSRKGLIFYKIEMEFQPLKNIMKLNIPTFKKCMLMKLFDDIVEINDFEFKQSSKVQKMVIPRSICECSIYFNILKIR